MSVDKHVYLILENLEWAALTLETRLSHKNSSFLYEQTLLL